MNYYTLHHITDYMYPEGQEIYHFVTDMMDILPNRDQFHFRNPVEAEYFDRLYEARDSFEQSPNLYRFIKLLMRFFGDRIVVRNMVKNIKKK